MSDLTPESPEVVDFGGMLWRRSISDFVDYEATQPTVGQFRVHQYPEESYSKGEWLWAVEFDTFIDPTLFPSIISMRCAAIVKTQEAAMQACLDAKDVFIADIKRLCLALNIGDYATGFTDGQAALSGKIKAVLP